MRAEQLKFSQIRCAPGDRRLEQRSYLVHSRRAQTGARRRYSYTCVTTQELNQSGYFMGRAVSSQIAPSAHWPAARRSVSSRQLPVSARGDLFAHRPSAT